MFTNVSLRKGLKTLLAAAAVSMLGVSSMTINACSSADAAPTDDPAPTSLAVRCMEGGPWTKPDQLTFDNLEAIPSTAIFADGTVQQLADNEDPNTLKAMITRAGGEKLKPKPDPIPKSAPYRPAP